MFTYYEITSKLTHCVSHMQCKALDSVFDLGFLSVPKAVPSSLLHLLGLCQTLLSQLVTVKWPSLCKYNALGFFPCSIGVLLFTKFSLYKKKNSQSNFGRRIYNRQKDLKNKLRGGANLLDVGILN